jgi:PAS domain S-box-containing protein
MLRPIINILIIEDNLDDLELLLLELRKGEYEFTYTHCTNRLTFESELVITTPDIIISDYNLPGYSGLEALIQSKKRFPHIPFLLLSSFIGEVEGVKMIVDHNASDYILKSDLHRLNPAVSREIKHSLIRKELDSKNDELQLLSMVVKQSHHSVIITDTEGRIEWVNEAFTNLTGYTFVESLGKKPGPMLQGEKTDTDAIQKITRKLKLQIPFQQEILNYTKNGDYYWIKLDISPVFNAQGNLSKFVAIQEDITKKRNDEQKYRNLFNNLIDEVHLWKFITDKNGNVKNWELVDANPSALKAWGKTIDQVVGKTTDKIFNLETKELFRPIVEKIFTSRQPESWELFFR